MKNIGQFFSILQNKHAKELFTRSFVSEALLKYAKIEVKPENVTFKGRVLMIQGLSQIEKSEVYIKKTQILAEINPKLGNRQVTDIR